MCAPLQRFPPAGPPLAVMCFLALQGCVLYCILQYLVGMENSSAACTQQVQSPVIPASRFPNDAATSCRSLPRVTVAPGSPV